MSGVTFTIASDVDSVRWACLAVRGILDGLRLARDDVYFVELAVSEAATNVVRHAYNNEPGHEFTLEVTIERNRLVLVLSDTGTPFDPSLLEEVDLPEGDESPDDLGGRGLFLIRQGMDEVAAARVGDRNVLTMAKFHGGVR